MLQGLPFKHFIKNFFKHYQKLVSPPHHILLFLAVTHPSSRSSPGSTVVPDVLKEAFTSTHCIFLLFHSHAETDPLNRSSPGSSSVTDALEDALKAAFMRTDAEFAADGTSSMVGTTAVVALVGSRKAWIANCGACSATQIRSHSKLLVLSA